MSTGQAGKPCDDFKHWFGNGMLCGRCAWQREDHANFPRIKKIVFALIFADEVVGYMMRDEENGNWLYSETYNNHSVWSPAPFPHAYSQIELAFIFPFHNKEVR